MTGDYPPAAWDASCTHLSLLVSFQWILSENINNFDDVKFDTASLLAQLYQQQDQSSLAKPVLRKAIELSQHNVYWHCKLLFQLAVRDSKGLPVELELIQRCVFTS